MDQRLQCCIVNCNAKVDDKGSLVYSCRHSDIGGVIKHAFFEGADAYGTAKVMKEGLLARASKVISHLQTA